LIKRAFTLGCLAGRDDADHGTMRALAVTHDKQLGRRTHAQHEEVLFFGRMLIIKKLNAKIIKKDRLGFFK
jgi:hypothetical protein